ncbi:DMT family transporter [Shumkonia mesophila]|uniref:DMT family transporter n=1 Tax=Shumkonia mesophila TaxID=2838854 RepID=UPI00293449D5|nr:DMT family transporter [Shumkonia mesophila]
MTASSTPPATAAPRASGAAAAAVLAIALAAVSHGSIFVRLADAHPFVVSAFRVGTAALVVVPVAIALRRRELAALDRRTVLASLGAGLFLALHFITWIASLGQTSIANSTVLVTLNPVWIAIATALITRRRPGGLVAASVTLSVAGCAVIAWGSAGDGSGSLVGDGLAVLGGMCAAGYLMMGRLARQRGISLISYVALCYGGAAVLLWALVLALGLPVAGLTPVTYGAMIGMGLISQVIGHSGYNWALKLFNPAFIAVCLLGEPILASALGLIYFGEAIPLATLAGAPIIMAGIYLGARAELR